MFFVYIEFDLMFNLNYLLALLLKVLRLLLSLPLIIFPVLDYVRVWQLLFVKSFIFCFVGGYSFLFFLMFVELTSALLLFI